MPEGREHAALSRASRQGPSILVAVVFGILIAVLGVIDRRYSSAAENSADAVAHTHSVLANLNATVASLVDAETGQRGFLITGEDRYLAPYWLASRDLDGRLNELSALVADNDEQLRDLAVIRTLVRRKLQELEETIALRRDESFSAAQQLVLTDRGKALMDQLRAVTQRMAAREQSLLQVRRATARRDSATARLATFASTGIAFVAIGLVWAGYRRVTLERLRAFQEAEAHRDVAEHRQHELESALEVKNEFLATVSHELRTPTNAIVGWARMLHQRTMRPEKVEAAIASLDANARTLAALIDDLLESSRLLTGKVRLEPQPLDVGAVVVDAVETVRVSAENRGVSISADISQVPVIRGDVARLKQVFWNVLGNAVKFTPPGGSVSVRVAQGAEGVDIIIVDTGAGIAPSFLPHVFDPFRQSEETVRSGLGLGLAIAKQLVELHGGTIIASSDGPGKGATFTVCLPTATTASGGRTPPANTVEGAA